MDGARSLTFPNGYCGKALFVASLIVRVLGSGIGLAAGPLARHGKPVAHVACGEYILESGRVFL